MTHPIAAEANFIPLTKETTRVHQRAPSRMLDRESEQTAAFEAFVHRQAGFVFRVANALLRNTGDAEDVVQETFLKLHRTGSWKDMREERAFLARMVWRQALDRKRAQATGQSLLVGVERLDSLQGSALSPEQLVASGDAAALVHQLIDALPDDLRQPLVLSAIDELNSREIAEVLGVKEGTVRTRLMRARAMLKEQLAGQMGRRDGRA